MKAPWIWLCACAVLSLAAGADTLKLTPAQVKAADALRGKGAIVMQMAADDDRLVIGLNLLGKQATDTDLAQVKLLPKVAELNLANTAVTDTGLAALEAIPTLQRLHLEHTTVTDAGLAHLKALSELEYLNLYATAVTDKGLVNLTGLKKLHKLFLWQTKVTDAGVATLRKANPALDVNRGEETAALLAVKLEQARKAEDAKKAAAAKKAAPAKPAEPPSAAGKPINDKCPVSGKPVDAKITVTYKGKMIAFCCGDCQKAFQNDPEAYLAKLGIATSAQAAAKPINTKCPVSGEDVDPKFTATYEGKVIAFCCGDCLKKFQKDPGAYLVKLGIAAKPQAAAKPINTKCPVSGEDVDPKFTATYEGKVIAFCCGDCLKKFQKDPKAYVARLTGNGK